MIQNNFFTYSIATRYKEHNVPISLADSITHFRRPIEVTIPPTSPIRLHL